MAFRDLPTTIRVSFRFFNGFCGLHKENMVQTDWIVVLVLDKQEHVDKESKQEHHGASNPVDFEV